MQLKPFSENNDYLAFSFIILNLQKLIKYLLLLIYVSMNQIVIIVIIVFSIFNHYLLMLRERPLVKQYEIRQRKKVNIDVEHNPDYDQFQGYIFNQQEDIIQQKYQKNIPNNNNNVYQQKVCSKLNEKDMEDQIQKYQNVLKQISKSGKKYRKVQLKSEKVQQKQQEKGKDNGAKIQISAQIKIENNGQVKESCNNKKTVNKTKNKKLEPISSNWKQFLQKSTTITTNKHDSNKIAKRCSQFIALDCQFVKCGQFQQLARLSIVDQQNTVLFDSYIKPIGKITDYVTQISGITFSHIKKAPTWKDQENKVKKILMNKILIGHTIEKDIQILKLNSWTGIRKTVDIASFSHYKQKNGKLTSLKNLAQKYLNKKIQSGWHSSVQDSIATMDLFKIHKKAILKENKII